MKTKSSPYLLIFHEPYPDVHRKLSPKQRQELVSQWNQWYDGLEANGKVECGHPLQPKGRMVSVTRGKSVVDGPYAEGKEVVGGYFFLRVASLAEATAIAKQCPSLPLGLRVEVRPIAEVSPALKGLRGRPAK